jgi:hypothetical protein
MTLRVNRCVAFEPPSAPLSVVDPVGDKISALGVPRQVGFPLNPRMQDIANFELPASKRITVHSAHRQLKVFFCPEKFVATVWHCYAAILLKRPLSGPS